MATVLSGPLRAGSVFTLGLVTPSRNSTRNGQGTYFVHSAGAWGGGGAAAAA
jgi:hypothetical protein